MSSYISEVAAAWPLSQLTR